MKNTLISVVLIWFTGFATSSFAKSPFNLQKEDIENIYIKTYDNVEITNEENTDILPDDEEGVIIDDLPRLKNFYIAGYGGYFYTQESHFEFSPVDNCKGDFAFNFICDDNRMVNPIKAEGKDEYFYLGAVGLNSQGPLRLELNYYKMNKPFDIVGENTVELKNIDYKTNIDLDGATANLYFDFVLNRRVPSFIFTPYAMAGIGISTIKLDDMTFAGKNGDISIAGKKQRNKTFVYGGGLTAGLNHYISLDIGYRHYDFGDIKTGDKMTETIVDNTDPLNPVTSENVYDIELQSEFEAHIVVIGLKIQI